MNKNNVSTYDILFAYIWPVIREKLVIVINSTVNNSSGRLSLISKE